MPRIEVRGDDSFTKLAKAIKASGDATSWRRELRNELRKATRPTIREVRASARSMLPKRGGLNRWVASSNVRTEIKTSGKGMGVRIKAGRDKRNGRADVNRINQGSVAHKTWGRLPWHKQGVAAGWFDKPIESETFPRTVEGVQAAVDRLLRKITQ